MRHAARGVALAACAAAVAGCFDFGSLKPKGDAGTGTDDAGDGEVTETCAEKTYACDGDELVTTCVDGSQTPTREKCAIDCNAAATVCEAIVPSFINESHHDWAVLGEYELVVSGTATLSTETGTVTEDGKDIDLEFKIEDQDDGAPKLAVFRLGRLEVKAGATLRIVGKHAVALVVRGNATIDGTIDVSADEVTGGPGGASGDSPDDQLALDPRNGLVGTAQGDGSQATYAYAGGGGGGNGTAGASGGDAKARKDQVVGADYVREGTGGAGGGVFGGGADPDAALVGGGAGGASNCGVSTSVRGGGGGGALAVSVSGILSFGTEGHILASGAGGRARGYYPPLGTQPCASGESSPGSGGGAGGTVWLETNAFEITGTASGVFANGGGGGGGSFGLSPSNNGEPGSASSAAAAGGAAHGATNGVTVTAGSSGGAAAAPVPEDALKADQPLIYAVPVGAFAGGGGGGVGRIVIRVREDASVPSGANFSPNAGAAFVADDSITDDQIFTPTRP